MSSHFQSYVSNLKRVRLIEMIDDELSLLRYSRARPSLIVNPLTGLPDAEDATDRPPHLLPSPATR